MNLHAAIHYVHDSDNEAALVSKKVINVEGFSTPPKSPICTVKDLRAIQLEQLSQKQDASTITIPYQTKEQNEINDGFTVITYKRKKNFTKETSPRVTRAHAKKP